MMQMSFATSRRRTWRTSGKPFRNLVEVMVLPRRRWNCPYALVSVKRSMSEQESRRYFDARANRGRKLLTCCQSVLAIARVWRCQSRMFSQKRRPLPASKLRPQTPVRKTSMSDPAASSSGALMAVPAAGSFTPCRKCARRLFDHPARAIDFIHLAACAECSGALSSVRDAGDVDVIQHPSS